LYLKIVGRLKCLCISIFRLLLPRIPYIKLHLQSALGQLQMLLGPDPFVKFFFENLKRIIRLVGVINNERSLKSIFKLSNEFCEEM